MINYCVLFTVLVHFFFVQARKHDSASGNVLSKSYSPLPQKPLIFKATATTCSCNHVLTFDDITNALNGLYATIPSGYGGLNWTNAFYMNTTYESVAYGWNGYATGLNSGVFVGFNANGLQMSISALAGQSFQFNGMVLAAAWRSNLVLTMQGLRANAVLYQTLVTLQVTSKTTLSAMKWSGIDTLTFSSTGGTTYPGLNSPGTNFVMDDIDITM